MMVIIQTSVVWQRLLNLLLTIKPTVNVYTECYYKKYNYFENFSEVKCSKDDANAPVN